MKKNGFTMVELIAIVVIMASMLLIILPAINNTIKNSEEKKKQESLNNIYMAAENYLMANYDDYKVDNVGDITYVYITDLISNNYMNIDTLNPNNDSTFSNKDAVKITRNEDGTFNYELVYLKTLIENLLEQYSPDNTTGLLRDSVNENLYYYKGTNEEVSNNFLWYGGHQWRVLEFDTNDNTLTLITQQPLTSISLAKSEWKNEETYNDSYINKWLNDYFWSSLDSSIKSNILDNTFNIGIYTDVDEITTTKKVGLLDYEQYKRTQSTDSFLNIKNWWWLGNVYDANNFCSIGTNGMLDELPFSYKYSVRAVIKISDITITGGDGTLANNYQVASKSTNTNNVQVGEYINVPYSGDDNACGSDKMCTFKVVSKDEDSIKVVLNGLLPTESEYGSSSTISTSHTIYTPLSTFANGISNTYRYTGNKTFYIGYVSGTGQNYEDVQDETLEASIGLPTVGEMFSGNDIDLSTSSTKIFVDINTIENPTASSYYWTMNRYNLSNVLCVSLVSGLISNNISVLLGVRPVIYLKNNLIFTGGDGSPQNPYTLD